jgi:hypothetical protein
VFETLGKRKNIFQVIVVTEGKKRDCETEKIFQK